MCCWCQCERGWTALTVIWALVYVSAGAVQIVTGIFLLIALPQHALCSNVWAGTWNVIAGISGGMVSCFGFPSPRRQRRLLYITVSVLIVNIVNAVISEWAFYQNGNPLILPNFKQEDQDFEEADMLTTSEKDKHVQSLIENARLTAGIAAAIILLVSFLDSQLTFCSIDSTRLMRRHKNSPRGLHEQVTDIEYIIPRPKTNSESKPSNTVYNAYAQSWVFETETTPTSNSNSNHAASPYLKQDQEMVIANGKEPHLSPEPAEETIIIANPVVHIEEASDESNSNSDRKLYYMKSFSRTPSPAVLSAASSQASLNQPPIYECLEKLTEPTVYRSRLNTALSIKEETPQYASTSPRKPDLPSPRTAEPAQYASLLLELEQAITNKKSPVSGTGTGGAVGVVAVTSPQSDTHTTSESSQRTDVKSSDAEFSRELEAALQLIQDLESPNMAEPHAGWRHSDSEKTLSAVGSLAELTSPIAECLPEVGHGHGKPHANRTTGIATAGADDRVQLLRTTSYDRGPEDDPIVQTVSLKGISLFGHPPPAQL